MRALLCMSFIATVLTAGVFTMTTAACSSDSKAATPAVAMGDGGVDNGGPPDPSVLFDPLPPASPNKLRGVWESKGESADGAIVVRLRFSDDFIGVAVRCTPKTGDVIDVPDIVGVDTTDLDSAMGTFDFDGISVSGTSPAGVQCGTALPEGPINFKIDGLVLTLSKAGVSSTIVFNKVGD